MFKSTNRFFSVYKFVFKSILLLVCLFSFNASVLSAPTGFRPPSPEEVEAIQKLQAEQKEAVQKFRADEKECKERKGENYGLDDDGKCIDKTSPCLWDFSLAGCLSSIADIIIGTIFSLINFILYYIFYAGTIILDLILYITVVKFTENFANLGLSGMGGFIFGDSRNDLIYYIWGMLRDFVNVMLLITIIYYAVRTMFEGFEGKSRVFIMLLIFSIVVNFSLFFIKFAIDISNILTLQAYTLMVKPVGFDTWDNFRKRASDLNPNEKPSPGNLGEYLMNMAGVADISNKDIGAEAAKERIESLKGSWVFEVCVMLVYLGLIYLTFFLVGFLLLRAAAFIFAMLLAALLAADIFFSVFDKKGRYEFADSIREYTGKIRDNFYEALIRPPILFLFLFLIGILANAIFNEGLTAEIKAITESGGDFDAMGNAFGSSLTIFLKFATFFVLCKVFFEAVSAIKIGKGDSKWISGGSGWIANKLTRPFTSIPGFAGRTFARRLDKGGFVGRNFQNLNSGFTRWANGNKWFLDRNGNARENTGVFKQVFRNIGRNGVSVGNSLRKGSYEVTQSRFGQSLKKTELGGQIAGATGIYDVKKYRGAEISGGFEERDKQYQAIRQKEIDAEVKVIKDNVVPITGDRNQAEAAVKLSIPNYGSISLSDYNQGKHNSNKTPSQMDAFNKFKRDTYLVGTNANMELNQAKADMYSRSITAAKARANKEATEYPSQDNSTLVGVLRDRLRGAPIEGNLQLVSNRSRDRIVANKHNVSKSFSNLIGNAANQYDKILNAFGVLDQDFNDVGSSNKLNIDLSNIQTQTDITNVNDKVSSEIEKAINGTASNRYLNDMVNILKKPGIDLKGLSPEEIQNVLTRRLMLSVYESKMKQQMVENKKEGVDKATAIANFEAQLEFRQAVEDEFSQGKIESLQNLYGDEALRQKIKDNQDKIKEKSMKVMSDYDYDNAKRKVARIGKMTERTPEITLVLGELRRKIKEHDEEKLAVDSYKVTAAGSDAILKDENAGKTAAANLNNEFGNYKKSFSENFQGTESGK